MKDDPSRFWKRIVNTINDGLMLVSPEGTILMVNRAFETLTGYQSSEVVGKSCDPVTPGSSRAPSSAT